MTAPGDDPVTNERDQTADVRERLADEREGLADERERLADDREAALDARERQIEAAGPGTVGASRSGRPELSGIGPRGNPLGSAADRALPQLTGSLGG
ncbi:MAG: hypothetical protein E6H98_06425 [Chloroflexi bacterium]|nr:MAG: hypothetical protein E6H98_06425 [Chloroflexota bacterium]